MSDESLRALGAELRACREAKGVSLRALARGLRRSHVYVGAIERGETKPSEAMLRAIAARLDVYDHVATDRWCALAGIVPASLVAALIAAPRRWDDVRAVTAGRGVRVEYVETPAPFHCPHCGYAEGLP